MGPSTLYYSNQDSMPTTFLKKNKSNFAYPDMLSFLPKSIQVKMKPPKIFYVPWVWPPYRGITLPPFGIFIKKEFKGNQKLLNHDLVHWQQYQKMGLFKFYFKYLKQFLIHGYDKMPLEIEARYEEDKYTKEHYQKIYHHPNKN